MATLIDLIELGNSHMAQGRHAEAADRYQQAVAIDSSHAGLHNNLGVALRGLGRLAEAASGHNRRWPNPGVPLPRFGRC